MDHAHPLAEFEEHRPHLRAVARRMLGSAAEADDAVQETWLRLHRSDTGDVQNLRAWLTTVVARVCLNMLQSRAARREEPLDTAPGLPATPAVADDTDPEHRALLADSIGVALMVVLDTLTPAERLAFVLHDIFAVPFDQIAPIVERTPAATRQLASRARRRVRTATDQPDADTDPDRQRQVVAAFLAAARAGRFDELLTLLDPDVVLRADPVAARAGASEELCGAHAVAGMFSGRALDAQFALVDASPGAVWAPGGHPRAVFRFTLSDGAITAIDLIADPDQLNRFDLAVPGI